MDIDVQKWPFRTLVVISLSLSCVHALVQFWWPPLRYRTFGPRPITARLFITSEALLQMIIMTIAISHICGKDRAIHRSKYVIGELAALGAWIVTSFVL
jgi:hypothetical protein